MMMMSSTVNKQAHLNQLNALGASKPQKPKGADDSPKVDLVDAKADTFELSAAPREAVADAQATPPPPALQEAPQKQNSFLAIGSGIIAIASAIGAGVAFHKAGVAEEGLTALKKEVDSNKALATAADTIAESAAKGAKELAENATELLNEVKDSHNSFVEGFKENLGPLVFANNAALVRFAMGDKTGLNELLLQASEGHGANLTFLSAFLNNAVNGSLGSKGQAELFPGLLYTLHETLSHHDIVGNTNPAVVKKGAEIQQLVAVLKNLPKAERRGTTSETKAAFKTAFEEAVTKHGAALDDPTKVNLKALHDKDESELHEFAYKSLEARVGELDAALKAAPPTGSTGTGTTGSTTTSPAGSTTTGAGGATGKSVITVYPPGHVFVLPKQEELSNFKDGKWASWKTFSAEELPAIKDRILGVGVAGLDYYPAQAILKSAQLKSDPELLAHVAAALADGNHPLATMAFEGGASVKDDFLSRLVESARVYSGTVDSTTYPVAHPIADKFARVLGELKETKDPAKTAETLAQSLGLDPEADKAHIELAVAHHSSNTNVEMIAKYVAQQLTDIQDALAGPVIG